MRLSVVIPALNEADGVAACVSSAQALGAGWGSEVEVVVSDGGSDDGTQDTAEAAGARVVTSPRGRGQQLRAGIEATTGQIVLMLHADTRLAPEAGAQLAGALTDPRVGCGSFRQAIDAPGRMYRWLEAGNAYRARRLGSPYGDQAIFVRRELLDSIGGLPDLPLMEDVELMKRLRRVSWPVLLEGPLHISARRWQRHGVVRQTLRNWLFLAAYACGVSPKRLLRMYKPHAEPSPKSSKLELERGLKAADLATR